MYKRNEVTDSITRMSRRQDTKEFDTFVLWRPDVDKSGLRQAF